MSTLLLKNATLVTMDPLRRIIKNGWLLIEDAHISQIGESADNAPSADATVDAEGKVALPGFINAHTHVNQILLRGGPSHGKQLYDWLLNVLHPGLKAMTPEDVGVATRLYCLEAVKAGITTVVDNADSALYDGFPEAALGVYKEVGERVVYARMFFDQAHPDMDRYGETVQARSPSIATPNTREDSERVFEHIESLFRAFHSGPEGRISVWPAPAITPMVSIEALKWAESFAEEKDVMWTVHMAETEHEERCHWMTPMDFLEHHQLLGPRLQCAHCVYSTPKDIRLMQKYDIKVASQPVSNGYLGSGVAPIPELVQRGVSVGIGTDDANCNDSVNMLSDMKIMAHVHRAARADANALTPEKILEMATIDGARTVGMEKYIGSLEVGKLADVILLDMKHPQTTPMHHIAATLVFQAYGTEIDTVIVNGEVLMQDRAPKRERFHEEVQLLDQAQSRAEALCKKVGFSTDPSWESL